MDKLDFDNFTAAAKAGIANFGTAAHKAIDLYREGGERLGTVAGERWDTAFQEARKELDADTRKNAKHARDVFAKYYGRGLALSADGAGVAVDTVVGAWIAGIERIGTFKHAKA
jgi:hypothetical protein